MPRKQEKWPKFLHLRLGSGRKKTTGIAFFPQRNGQEAQSVK